MSTSPTILREANNLERGHVIARARQVAAELRRIADALDAAADAGDVHAIAEGLMHGADPIPPLRRYAARVDGVTKTLDLLEGP